ncbi:very short patch repair endonuclease [Thalassolituus alkanivorans]|uniref:very short patch repair endonuclease n=1 Tax=Thalassolituus alkanivorans TaxID=2881055 RepID=UPI002E1DB62F|nr:very short patch repair endonuclease [Thalassolituus alkanivorans]MCB2421552.1 very short patch repair endonuclease [Thalassolituus alkanivorans]
MTDVHDEITRSRNMSAICGTNTRPELLIRKELFARGYRYRLNDKRLPGKPDLVLKKYRAVIFVHGCFWHRHNCPQFKWPSTRAEWWKEKLEGNRGRDQRQLSELQELGWRTLVVWECALKGKLRLQPEDLFEQIEGWLLSDTSKSEICGSF